MVVLGGRHTLSALLGCGVLVVPGAAHADGGDRASGGHHHSTASLRHGDVRPAVLGSESATGDPLARPGHPEHEPPHESDGGYGGAETAGGHRDSLHHNALDHEAHYHGLYSGYPNYYGYALGSEPPAREVRAAQPLVAVAGMRPPPRSFRFGGGVSMLSSHLAADGRSRGFGALVRIRGGLLEAELELGREASLSGNSSATRFGGALYLNLVRDRALIPYILAGSGVRFPHDRERQVYLEGGAGLAHPLTPRLSLSADLRWSTRRATLSSAPRDRLFAPGPASEQDDERKAGLALRLAAILYF